MSNYCKRIAKRKLSGYTIAKALIPSINYFYKKGAKEIYIDFDNKEHRLSIRTPDVVLSKEEMTSPELLETIKSLSPLSRNKKSKTTIRSST